MSWKRTLDNATVWMMGALSTDLLIREATQDKYSPQEMDTTLPSSQIQDLTTQQDRTPSCSQPSSRQSKDPNLSLNGVSELWVGEQVKFSKQSIIADALRALLTHPQCSTGHL